MANKVSAITVPHKENCEAVEWVKDNPEICPHEWNVFHIIPIPRCDENGNQNPIGVGGSLYYEFFCADDTCPARKRVHAQAIAQL